MSQVTVEQLQNEVKNLIAQLEASKAMLNEQLASNHQLRSTLNLFNQVHKDTLAEIANLKAELIAVKNPAPVAPEVEATEKISKIK